MASWPWADKIEWKYQEWVNGPTLFGHPLDQERFYKFVWACLNNQDQAPTPSDLKERLEVEQRAPIPEHIAKAGDLLTTLQDFMRAAE